MVRTRQLGLALLAALSCAQAQGPPESGRILAAAREKILAVAQRLPRYTCLETINRSYLERPASAIRGKVLSAYAAPSCSATVDHPAGDLVLASSDRLRLEVAVSGHREIESWPGATRFDSRTIDEIVKFGPTSTGAFGTYLIEAFENPGAKIEFSRETTVSGRRTFEYRFEIPFESSHYRVKVAGEWRNIASSGSFEVAVATADLTRFIIQTAILPAGAEMCQAKTSIDYQQLQIGGGDLLIPRESELQTVQSDSSRTKSVSTFSACHEYTAESSIRFDDDPLTAGESNKTQAGTAALPAGLSLELKLNASIDTRTAAAGDVVFANVTKAVISPGSKRILIPNGAKVHGRISDMRQFISPSRHFQIGLVFDSVELQGIETPVTLELDRGIKVERSSAAIVAQGGSKGFDARLKTRAADLNIPPPTHGDGGVFVFMTAEPRYIVPAGYESKWITRQPRP